MGRILVIRGGALGDFVLTLPALAALRAQFPNAELHVLGYPQYARLALLGDLAHGVHPIEARALAGFFGRHTTLDPATSDFFSGFDVVVSYLYDPDQIFEDNVRRCAKERAQFIAGPHRPDEAHDVHATSTFLRPLERFAIFDAEPQPRLRVPPQPPGPGRWIAMHPGSGSPAKNWPEPHWASLIAHTVRHTDAQVLLLSGEAEGDRARRLVDGLPEHRVQIAERRPLVEVAGLLAGCCAFIGHDSGVSHLAAAVGTPCWILWGPTRLPVWRPLGPHVQILATHGGLSQLTPEQVCEAVPALA
ncbi:MAG: glycosyltransferase family 9 protein [Verrucomicrobiales bacterium]|nr:glycosyltransferase family 9 protein [Verrucomicrobiales bacterium]